MKKASMDWSYSWAHETKELKKGRKKNEEIKNEKGKEDIAKKKKRINAQG